MSVHRRRACQVLILHMPQSCCRIFRQYWQPLWFCPRVPVLCPWHQGSYNISWTSQEPVRQGLPVQWRSHSDCQHRWYVSTTQTRQKWCSYPQPSDRNLQVRLPFQAIPDRHQATGFRIAEMYRTGECGVLKQWNVKSLWHNTHWRRQQNCRQSPKTVILPQFQAPIHNFPTAVQHQPSSGLSQIQHCFSRSSWHHPPQGPRSQHHPAPAQKRNHALMKNQPTGTSHRPVRAARALFLYPAGLMKAMV